MAINSEKTFQELIERYHKDPDQFIFFVGAGLSQPLFPSWGNLLKLFVESANENNLKYDKKELLEYIEKGENFIDIAEECISTFGKTRYRDILEEIFDKNIDLTEIPEAYKALIDLSPNTIITTNYDRIPDIIGQGMYRVSSNKNAAEALRQINNNKKTVIKLHGDVNDHSSIVLTSNDYSQVINNNESVKILLTSLLSTKILIFVGFSLSDPHITTTLNRIKTYSNDIPLGHFVLLNESSSFKISSIERNFGVKVISYTPENKNHSEVTNFLKALNSKPGEKIEKTLLNKSINIANEDELIDNIRTSFEKTILNTEFSIFSINNDFHFSFVPLGETTSEIQKEILSIIKLFNFECDFLKFIHLSIKLNTKSAINIDRLIEIPFSIKIDYQNAKKYADKQITTTTLWNNIEFYSNGSLTDILSRKEKINFPLSTSIIGD